MSMARRPPASYRSASPRDPGDREAAHLRRRLPTERRGSVTKKVLDLDNDLAALLVGEHDANLKTLEHLLDCDISLRGNELTLEGSAAEVERVLSLVEDLLSLVGSGHPLDKATVKLAAAMTLSGNGKNPRLESIVGDVI